MAQAAKTSVFDTGHAEMIHDAQLDYYGKRLATASSDRTIRVFEVAGEQQQLIAELKGHDGPVFQIAWAHPKFGILLASCSYDGKVVIWKEAQNNAWGKVYESASHESAVNAVSWAPHTFGLILAAASADGTVSVHSRRENNTWERVSFPAHKGGCNAVSWGPDLKTGSLLASAQSQQSIQYSRRFVTAGCDNRIKIWRYSAPRDGDQGGWSEQQKLFEGDNKHQDWVRDVAWAPSLGLPSSTIASASEDKTVGIWTEDANGMWRRAKTLKFEQKVWKVSWSVMGNILAVSQGDNKVSLWKESVDGQWKNLSSLSENSVETKENKSAPSELLQ